MHRLDRLVPECADLTDWSAECTDLTDWSAECAKFTDQSGPAEIPFILTQLDSNLKSIQQRTIKAIADAYRDSIVLYNRQGDYYIKINKSRTSHSGPIFTSTDIEPCRYIPTYNTSRLSP